MSFFQIDLLAYGAQGWGDELLRGAVWTVFLAFFGYVLAFFFGLLGAGAKLSQWRVLRFLGEGYTVVIRGVPELLVIYLIYFTGLNLVEPWMQGLTNDNGRLIFDLRPSEMSSFILGVFAVALISGSYATEVIRGAVAAIPKGQVEAALACGMPRFLILRRILVPQILRYAIPGLGNIAQLTIKDTALVSVMGLAELLRWSQTAANSTRQPFTFFLSAAILYLLMTAVTTFCFQQAEKRAMRGVYR